MRMFHDCWLQGWRLEIKLYPKLTEFGAWRGKDEANMYGGFYTQEEVRSTGNPPVPRNLYHHVIYWKSPAFCNVALAKSVWTGGLQVREVVAYATRRFITVVPEIELPGHCGAALACYPHLACEHFSSFLTSSSRDCASR